MMSIEIFSFICIYVYMYVPYVFPYISVLKLRISKLFFKQRHAPYRMRAAGLAGGRSRILRPHEYDTDVGLRCQASASVSRDFKLLDPSALIWPNVDYVV